MLNRYHSEIDAINVVIDFQSIGLLYLIITGLKEEALPVPTYLLDVLELTLPRYIN